MKGKIVKNKYKAQRAVSMVLAMQLALSLSPIAAFAESDTLTNNTLPMAQPAPSQLVQKIWSSLDIRKLAARKNGGSSSKTLELVEKKPVANDAIETAAKKIAKAPAGEETESTASGVTSTGQMVFPTPGENEKAAAANSSLTTQTETANVPAATLETKSTDTKSTDTDSSKTPVAKSEEKIAPPPGAATEPVSATATSSETAAAAAVSTGSTEASAPGSASSSAASSPTFSANTDKPISIANALISLPPGSVLGRVQMNSDAVIVDNDEVEEIEETIKQEEIQTDEGKTRAKAGARFPVVISSGLNSKTSKKGEPITARLKYDLKIGDKLIAKKGSVVNGHINYSLKARTILHSLVSPERWYRNSGCIGLSFDEIINDKGEHLPLVAVPSRQARIVKNKAEGRELGVNQYGQVTGPWAQQLRYKAVRIGLNFALAPAGVFSFGAMPLALGVLGAANPSFAFSKPVGLNVRHRRIKGFAWGFLSGVPGSFLIEDTTVKGQEAIIKPGDEFYAEFVQEFTGEPASDAQLLPGASTKLRGEIVKDPKKATKKKSSKK